MKYVIRKKYHGDILFSIDKIVNKTAYLSGVYVRICATANLDDLIYIPENEIIFYSGKVRQNRNIYDLKESNKNHLTGKILHIDSDIEYLKNCNKIYESLGLYAICIYLKEDEISFYIKDLVSYYNVDIVILTGHDSFNQKDITDLSNYKNTNKFIKSIKILRKHYTKDELYIYAGACGSNFEALIANGANCASSPKRVNIDALDPLVCAVIVATTPFNKIVPFEKIWQYSFSKEQGLGGIDSFGKMRMLR